MSKHPTLIVGSIFVAVITGFFSLVGILINYFISNNHPPIIKDFKADKPSPQSVQTAIKFIANAEDYDGDVVRYRFWLKVPETNNIIAFMQDWSTQNSWDWKYPKEPGDYQIGVHIRDGRHAASNEQDDSRFIPYTITQIQQSFFMDGLKLPLGPNSKGTWQRFVKDQTYVMENRQDPETVNYFYVEDNIHEGWRETVVKVQVESDQDTTAGAGLIYALDPQQQTYYIYSLGTNGEIHFFKKEIGSENLEILCAEKPNIDMRQFNELRIYERDKKIEMYFNGRIINTYEGIRTGFSGIVAYGTGRFQFKDFNYKVNK